MPTILCPNVIDCPGQDPPITNWSAEDADVRRFLRVGFFRDRPRLGWTGTAVGCVSQCFADTQAEADDCARNQARLCVWDSWTDQNGNPVGTFFNSIQSCTRNCPDGSPFVSVVPASRVVALSQGEANAQAQALACFRAITNRICISQAGQYGCVGDAFEAFLTAAGGDVPVLWTYGALPAGLSAELYGTNQLRIYGTPTASGLHTFNVTAYDTDGDYMTKAISVRIMEITTAAVDDAIVGQPYTFLLAAAGSASGAYVWDITSGALPDGLTLLADGTIQGTPTTEEVATFTVRACDNGGAQCCTKEFGLTVNSAVPTPDVYWKLEGPDAGLAGKWKEEYAGAIHLTESGTCVVESGIIGSCLKQDDAVGYFLQNAWPGNGGASLAATSITFRGWAKTPYPGNNYSRILSKISGVPSIDYIFEFFNSDFPLAYAIRLYLRLTGGAGSIDAYFDATAVIDHTGWNHCVASWNEATKFLNLWMNGTNIHSAQYLGRTRSVVTSTTLKVGWQTGTSWIDEVGIWHQAWDQAMVTADYNAGLGRTFP